MASTHGPRPNEGAEEIGVAQRLNEHCDNSRDHKDTKSSCGEEGAAASEHDNDNPFPGTSIQLIKLESSEDPNWSSTKGLKMETADIKSESDEEISDNEEAEDGSEVPGDSDGGAYHLAEVSYGEEDDEHQQKSTGVEGNSASLDRVKPSVENAKAAMAAADYIIRRKNSKIVDENGVVRNKNFECRACGHRTGQKRTLLEHIYTHTGEKLHQCRHCNKSFRQGGYLVRHVRLFHSAKAPRVKCQLCERRFLSETERSTHVKRIHKNERPFACDRCDYRAKVKDSLEKHQKTHTKERPYPCSFCDYRCAYPDLLRRHTASRHGTQTYSCEQCEYKTTVIDNFKNHMKKHSADSMISCERCEFKTHSKGNLKGHIRTVHLGIRRSFNCPTCGTKFKSPNSLSKHVCDKWTRSEPDVNTEVQRLETCNELHLKSLHHETTLGVKTEPLSPLNDSYPVDIETIPPEIESTQIKVEPLPFETVFLPIKSELPS